MAVLKSESPEAPRRLSGKLKVTLSRFSVVTFLNTPMVFTHFIIVSSPLLRFPLQWLLFEQHMAMLPGWSLVMRRSGPKDSL